MARTLIRFVHMVVHLNHGVFRDGVWHRSAETRPITGLVEAALADLPRETTMAAKVTALIAGTTARIGTRAPTADDIRSLTVGDRERLLAALLRENFGSAVDGMVRCEAPACGTAMELEIDVDDLLPPADRLETAGWSGDPPAISTTVTAGGAVWQMRVRLPNGSDLEAAAKLAGTDITLAADLILERCAIETRDAQGLTRTPGELPAEARRAIGEELRRLDPLAENILTLTCPACATSATCLLDVGAFVLRMVERGGDVFKDVFRMARAYHWSEADILALPAARRRRYLVVMSAQEPA